MTGQKVENLLNLALDATDEEREKSLRLDIGYDPIERSWELIIKYSGNLEMVRELADRVTELMNEYAVVTVRESRIEELAALPQVEYIEKPKRLFFQTANGRRVSCIDTVQDTRFSLFGQGVLVAVIDSGIDYTLADFCNADGTTRIRALWDQSLRPREGERAPNGYEVGVEYTQETINKALMSQTPVERGSLIASRDTSGHGTAVAGIAAGNGRSAGADYRRYAGVAPESELLIVKLGNPSGDGFPGLQSL